MGPYALLAEHFPPTLLRQEVPMAAWTSFAAGGSADALLLPQQIEQIQQALALCHAAQIPVTILGLGTDVLVADAGIRGLTMVLAQNFSRIVVQGERMIVRAGASLADMAAMAARRGLSGLEDLCGIPGTLGGAVMMNAGAYEQSLADVLHASTYLTPDGQRHELLRDAHDFAYRKSFYTGKSLVILEAELILRPGDCGAIYERMAQVQAKRRASQPLALGSGGSAFKRPTGHYAGKLISDAGLKGYRKGACGISEQHAGFIVNYGGATATELAEIFQLAQREVFERFGVCLQPEVKFIGEWGALAWNC